jgi:hypothetical protein
VHPLVLRHPKTGIPALYLNVGLTGGILGYSPEHSRALMDAVDRHYSRPGASYRHHWLPGDVVVADNLHVAHKATPITPATRRILNRTTVRADGVIWAERKAMKQLTFKQKLWLPLFASLVCLCAISVFHVMEARDLRFTERKADLADVAKVALKVVEGLAHEAARQDQRGGSAGARQGGVEKHALRRRWLHGDHQHGRAPDTKSGQAGERRQGSQQFHRSLRLLRVPRDRARGGVGPRRGLSQLFLAASRQRVSQKLARIVSFKPWGWALVSGLYVDDINAAFYASLWRVAGMMAVVCLLLAAIVLAVNAACTYHRQRVRGRDGPEDRRQV